MANIDLSEVTFYINGRSNASTVVGNDWENNAVASRVARYTIVPPAEGAMGLKLYFKSTRHGGGEQAKKINIRYFIGISDSSHVNAGPSYEYTGEFEFDSTTLVFTAETDMMLLPGQTYYLWLFPASNDFGWYYWSDEPGSSVTHEASMESLGGIGVVYIKGDTDYEPYQIYIYGDNGWEQHMVYGRDDSEWNLCC